MNPPQQHDMDIETSSIAESDDTTEEPDDREPKEELVIAKAETKAVRWLKLVVLVVLLISAVVVAVSIYTYTSGSEKATFEIEFREHSVSLLEGIGVSLVKTLGTLDALQADLVSWARATNQTWPFVTAEDFAVRASKIRMLSAVRQVVVSPLVTAEDRLEWESYSLKNQDWVNESINIQATDEFYYGPINYNYSVHGVVHGHDGDVPYNKALMLPSWQASPVGSRYPPFNLDYLSIVNPAPIVRCIEDHLPVLAPTRGLPDISNAEDVAENEAWTDRLRDFVQAGEDPGEPSNELYYPITNSDLKSLRIMTKRNNTPPLPMVGVLSGSFFWRDLLKDLLPSGMDGMILVISSKCSPDFTYQIDGPEPTFLGRGDLHDQKFDSLGVGSSLQQLSQSFYTQSRYTGLPIDDVDCGYNVTVYPSMEVQEEYITSNPSSMAIGAVLIFVFTSVVFLLYDFTVEQRQRKVMTNAVRTNAIVSSLFPAVVRDRIFPTDANVGGEKKAALNRNNTRSRLSNFLNDGTLGQDEVDGNTKCTSSPVAELFPEATVFFADLAGFTAWSSAREPTHVFTLLETLYGAFDSIARRRGVFKIETIGDCYVAVCGLPEPRADHAVAMVRFARDCRDKMVELTRELGITLGQDTVDLKLRIGLNSGPVTAGVLRGERARFQLFGDTVNCAARMESNGKPGKIHISQTTADLLCKAGKQHWVEKRKELIEAKGKGKMQTYWVDTQRAASSSHGTVSAVNNSEEMYGLDFPHIQDMLYSDGRLMSDKATRLTQRNFEVFEGLIRSVVARRIAVRGEQQPGAAFELELRPSVVGQLRDYTTVISHLYRSNAFHNFDHASHVAMSAFNLLQRASESASEDKNTATNELAVSMHSSSYNSICDPLTQFAIVFAALIHDVDHPGVSNDQLVAEHSSLALHYNNQSVAEQNSVDIAWKLFMKPSYDELRATLFVNEDELQHFRHLVVNLTMATDLFDHNLQAAREARWKQAFHSQGPESSIIQNSEDSKRQANSIIEHLIQASDVSYTMQHWEVYHKWNRRLFEEMCFAFKAGRSPTNPAVGWYKGELWFFDNYIIPLAKKLKVCSVFGALGDEFLDRALDNRAAWEAKGESIVEEFVQHMESLSSSSSALIQNGSDSTIQNVEVSCPNLVEI